MANYEIKDGKLVQFDDANIDQLLRQSELLKESVASEQGRLDAVNAALASAYEAKLLTDDHLKKADEIGAVVLSAEDSARLAAIDANEAMEAEGGQEKNAEEK